MAKRPLPTPDELRQFLTYDPDTGKLFWKPREAHLFGGDTPRRRAANCSSWNAQFAGKEAFIGIDAEGYRQGTIFGYAMKAHRVAWAIHHGVWPVGQIGRDNGDHQDNRIANLKDVSHSQALKNCRLSKRNTSGVVGVSWDKRTETWRASINVGGRTKYIGSYRKMDEAVAARRAAEAENGFHPRHGERRTTPTKFVPKNKR